MEKSGRIFQINHHLSEEKRAAESESSPIKITFYRFIGGNASETDEMVKQLFALKREKGMVFGIFRFPFRFEGKKRHQTAVMQYYMMSAVCDGITYFYGDGMLDILKPGTSVKQANDLFSSLEEATVHALERMICIPGDMNIDLHDIQTFMTTQKGPFFLHSFEGDSFDEPLKYIISAPYLPFDFADGLQMVIQIGYARDVEMDSFRQINLRLNDLFHKADVFKIGTYFIDEPGHHFRITLLVNGLKDPFPCPDNLKGGFLQSLSFKRMWSTMALLHKKWRWLSPAVKQMDTSK
jgi:cell division protein FtsZ